MKTLNGAPQRALITLTATGAAVSIGLLCGAGSAAAHVTVDADNPAPGSTSVIAFRVPGESDTGALTTQLNVALPNVTSVRTEVMPGWTANLDRDVAAGNVRSVTWTAAPGIGISSDQFAMFRISVKLPNQDSVSFPATQTYSDGTVVHWDQPPLSGGGEPEHPAPTLSMSKSGPATAEHADVTPVAQKSSSTADNAARWLAGGALVVAAVGVVAAVLVRRRT